MAQAFSATRSAARGQGAGWLVIANCEDEFAIWPASSGTPAAWRVVGLHRRRADCEAYIQRIEGERRAAALRANLENTRIRP